MLKPRIIIAGATPAFSGNQVPGYNLPCHQCGRILIESAYDRQVLGLAIQCSCGETTETQERFAGEPIPSGPVVMDEGDYLISKSIDIAGKSAALVSSRALANYRSEVGVGYQNMDRPSDLDAAFLSRAADNARNLVDPAVYEHHLRKLHTLEASSIKRHRLIDLAEYSRTTADLLSKSSNESVSIDGNLISELLSLNSLFERWRKHPAYAELRTALVNSNDVQHSLIQLLTASYLADHGNGVGIIFGKNNGGRIPDLFVRPTVHEIMQVEVKTPRALRGPIEAIADEGLYKIVEDHLNKAASSSHGQLDNTKTGLVAIGAFHLGLDTLDRMEGIAQSILRKQAGRKPHLAGVIIAMQTYTMESAVTDQGVVLSRRFTPSAEFRVAQHPGYRGPLVLQSS